MPTGVYKHTAEHNRRVSEALKGKRLSEETKQKIREKRANQIPPMLGKHHSDKTKKRISETHKGLIPWNKGKKTGIKTSGCFQKDHIPWIKGKHHSAKARKKMSNAQKARRPDLLNLSDEQKEDRRTQCSKNYREKYREKILKQSKVYYIKNKKEFSDKAKQYYKRNKEKIKKRVRLYYKEHKKEIQKQIKEYNQTPKAKAAKLKVSQGRRTAVIYAKVNNLTTNQIQILFSKSSHCSICKKPFNKKRKKTLDHIIPLSKNGNHTILNTQILCPNCNARKGAKDYTKFNGGQILMFLEI